MIYANPEQNWISTAKNKSVCVSTHNKKRVLHNTLAVAICVPKLQENGVIYISSVEHNTCVATARQLYTGYATIAIELMQQSTLTGLVRCHGYWVLRREREGGFGRVRRMEMWAFDPSLTYGRSLLTDIRPGCAWNTESVSDRAAWEAPWPSALEEIHTRAD